MKNHKERIYNVINNRTGHLIDHIIARSENEAYKKITKGLKELNKENKFTSKNITIKYVKENFNIE
jgi:hypothetical protein